MPGVSGRDLTKEIRKKREGINPKEKKGGRQRNKTKGNSFFGGTINLSKKSPGKKKATKLKIPKIITQILPSDYNQSIL